MNLESTYSRNPQVAARRVAEETILAPIGRCGGEKVFYTLNEVGTFVWERLDGRLPLSALIPEIVESFDVESDTAAADLARFVEQLVAAGCAKEVPA